MGGVRSSSGSSQRRRLKPIAVAVITLSLVPLLFTSMLLVEDITGFDRNGEDDLRSEMSRLVGGLAWDYLKNDHYPLLLIECDVYDDQLLHHTNPFDRFNTMVDELLMKEGVGFEMTYDLHMMADQESYTIGDLFRLAALSRDYRTTPDYAAIHILFLNGQLADSTDVPGLCLDASTIVVFPERLSSLALQTVLAHELGHLLGLVAAPSSKPEFIPPNAQKYHDHYHPHHCTSPGCLMGHELLIASTLCDDCLEDLEWLRQSPVPYGPVREGTVDVAPVLVASSISILLLGAGLIASRTSLSAVIDGIRAVMSTRRVIGLLVVLVILSASLLTFTVLSHMDDDRQSLQVLEEIQMTLPEGMVLQYVDSAQGTIIVLGRMTLDGSYEVFTFRPGDDQLRRHDIPVDRFIWPFGIGDRVFIQEFRFVDDSPRTLIHEVDPLGDGFLHSVLVHPPLLTPLFFPSADGEFVYLFGA